MIFENWEGDLMDESKTATNKKRIEETKNVDIPARPMVKIFLEGSGSTAGWPISVCLMFSAGFSLSKPTAWLYFSLIFASVLVSMLSCDCIASTLTPLSGLMFVKLVYLLILTLRSLIVLCALIWLDSVSLILSFTFCNSSKFF